MKGEKLQVPHSTCAIREILSFSFSKISSDCDSVLLLKCPYHVFACWANTSLRKVIYTFWGGCKSLLDVIIFVIYFYNELKTIILVFEPFKNNLYGLFLLKDDAIIVWIELRLLLDFLCIFTGSLLDDQGHVMDGGISLQIYGTQTFVLFLAKQDVSFDALICWGDPKVTLR